MNYDESLALAINSRMVGKPADHQKHEGHWQRKVMRPSDLMQMVTAQGYAFTCSLKKDGARNKEAFDALNLAGLDFDHCGIDQVTSHPLAR